MKNSKAWLAALSFALAAALPVAAGAWTHQFHKWVPMKAFDRLTGEQEALGVYTLTSPEEPSPSAYADIHGQLLFPCRGSAAFFYLVDLYEGIVEFLPRGTEDWIEIRARLDNEAILELNAYTYGERDSIALVSVRDFNALSMIGLAGGRTLLRLEVPSVEGDLYFDFNLTGLYDAHWKHCG